MLPGKSLDTQFEGVWQRFIRLPATLDSLGSWTVRVRRWLTPLNISFIIPIHDETVCHYLTEAQRRLAPHMSYDPQPLEKLHITLYLMGYLRAGFAFRYTWTREEVDSLIEQATGMFRKLPSFTVKVGPFNAFPNVAIAEVRDEGHLRLLERAAMSVIPESRRMPMAYTLLPHITLGYFGSRATAPIVDVLRPLRDVKALPLKVDSAAVTLYYRGFGTYRAKYLLTHSVEETLATLQLDRR